MEESNGNVLQEVVSPDLESVSHEIDNSTPIANEALPQEEIQQEDPQEKNWRELRQTLKEVKRENQYLAQKLLELDRGHLSQEPQERVDEDDLVTYKTLKKYEEKLENKFRQKEAETAVDRLKAKFSDFEEVVTAENVEYLKENEPELVASLQALQKDPYAQAVAAYKLLKKTDFYLNKENLMMKKKSRSKF